MFIHAHPSWWKLPYHACLTSHYHAYLSSHHISHKLHDMLSMRSVSDTHPPQGFHFISSYVGDDVKLRPQHLNVCILIHSLRGYYFYGLMLLS